jgi:hypothetical protein
VSTPNGSDITEPQSDCIRQMNIDEIIPIGECDLFAKGLGTGSQGDLFLVTGFHYPSDDLRGNS